MAGKSRSRHAVRMADGDRSAVDVKALVRYAQLVAAIDHLDGERLVELPQADVVDVHPRPREELRYGKDRTDAHFVGLAAGDGETAEYPERLEAAARRELVADHDASRGAVGELAGVAGGDDAAGHCGLDLRHRLVRRIGADAF